MLFPNQFVNARLLLDVRQGTVVVPAAAVQRGPASTFVYVVGPDDKAELRNVMTGPTEADSTVVMARSNSRSSGDTSTDAATCHIKSSRTSQIRSSSNS